MSEAASNLSTGAVRRLFFALWPTAALRAAIETSMAVTVIPLGGRRIPLDNLHLTLAFLGAVPAERLPAIRSLASCTHGTAFELTFDRLRTFRRSGVLCLTAARVPSALVGLVTTLRQALRQVGCEVDDRPFVPHLTLARRVTRQVPISEVTPLVWKVQSFALVESCLTPRGAQYQIIDQWPLDS